MSQELLGDLRVLALNVTEVAYFNDKRVKAIGVPVEPDDCLRKFEINELSSTQGAQLSTIISLQAAAAASGGNAFLWATYPAVTNPTLQNSTVLSSAGFGLNVSTLSSQSMSFGASRLPCTLTFSLTGISTGHIYNTATMPLVAQSTYNTFIAGDWSNLSIAVDYLLKLSSVSDFNAVASTFSSLRAPISTVQGQLNALSSATIGIAQNFSTLRAAGGTGQCSSLAAYPLSSFTFAGGVNPVVLPGNQTSLFTTANPVIIAGCNSVQYTRITGTTFDGTNTSITFEAAPTAAGGYITLNNRSNTCATAEGRLNVAGCNFVTVEGASNLAGGLYTHVEGLQNISYDANSGSNHIEGASNIFAAPSRGAVHIEGLSTNVSGPEAQYDHYEGFGHRTTAYSQNNHIEGYNNSNVREYNHIQGAFNIVISDGNHIEGSNHVTTNTFGAYLHLEGVGHSSRANVVHIHGLSNAGCNRDIHIEGLSNECYGVAGHMMGFRGRDTDSSRGPGVAFTNSCGILSNVGGPPIAGGNQYCKRIQRVRGGDGGSIVFGNNADTNPGNITLGVPGSFNTPINAQRLIAELVCYEKNNIAPTPIAGDGTFMAEYHIIWYTDNRGNRGAINSEGGFAQVPSTLLCTPLWTAGRLTNNAQVRLILNAPFGTPIFQVETPTLLNSNASRTDRNWALKITEIDLLRANY